MPSWLNHLQSTHANLKKSNADQKFGDSMRAASKSWNNVQQGGNDQAPSDYPGVYGATTKGGKRKSKKKHPKKKGGKKSKGTKKHKK